LYILAKYKYEFACLGSKTTLLSNKNLASSNFFASNNFKPSLKKSSLATYIRKVN